MGDTIKKWLEVEPEKKVTLSYDFNGLWKYDDYFAKVF